jgi:hypothetical protein
MKMQISDFIYKKKGQMNENYPWPIMVNSLIDDFIHSFNVPSVKINVKQVKRCYQDRS